MATGNGIRDEIIIEALAGIPQPDGSKLTCWLTLKLVTFLATGNPSGQGLNAVYKTLQRLRKKGFIDRLEIDDMVYYRLSEKGFDKWLAG